MLQYTDYILIFVLGSIGGFVSGFLGVGGGIIFIPILDYYLFKMGLRNDLLVKGILANSLFTVIFSGLIASYTQYKLGNFFLKEILKTAIPGIITALVLTHFIKSDEWYSKTVFNIVFASVLLIIVLLMIFKKKPQIVPERKEGKTYQYSLTGMLAGVFTAFTGLGGGVLLTPIFTDILKHDIRKASSISNGIIPLFAIAIAIHNLAGSAPVLVSEWQIGYIVFPVVIPMILATLVFAPIGVRTSQKTKSHIIHAVFISFVSVVFIKLLYEIIN